MDDLFGNTTDPFKLWVKRNNILIKQQIEGFVAIMPMSPRHEGLTFDQIMKLDKVFFCLNDYLGLGHTAKDACANLVKKIKHLKHWQG